VKYVTFVSDFHTVW